MSDQAVGIIVAALFVLWATMIYVLIRLECRVMRRHIDSLEEQRNTWTYSTTTTLSPIEIKTDDDA